MRKIIDHIDRITYWPQFLCAEVMKRGFAEVDRRRLARKCKNR